MPAEEVRSLHDVCPLCSGASLKDKYSVDGYTLTRCAACTLLFVRERLEDAELAAFYESSGGDQVYSDAENRANLSVYDVRVRALLERHRRSPGRILDVGCSDGRFLDAMEGWDRYGVELHRGSAERARARYGERIHVGTLESHPGPAHSFDVVTLFDVFDHVAAPLATLDACRRLLRPGGLVVVKVHDISCLYARLMGSRFYAIVPPAHLFYYDRRTLEAMLKKGGFRKLEARHIGHVLFLKNIPYRLSKGREASLLHRLYRRLEGTKLGGLRVPKNLHDIITVVATLDDR